MSQIFRFKQFNINQQDCAMKIGTDAMLMGSLARPEDAQNILDIGTGTGVLALMMAQQCPHAIIDAIEPDSVMAVRAAENFENSIWDYRLTLYNEALQEYTNLDIIHYEYIICNPPYFEPSPTTRPDRVNARSTVSLTFDELMMYGEMLLSANGKIGVIVPEGEYNKLLIAALKARLHPVRKVFVSSFENTPVIRRITEFMKTPPESVVEERLYIYNDDKTWSEKYTLLTAEFHNLDKEA